MIGDKAAGGVPVPMRVAAEAAIADLAHGLYAGPLLRALARHAGPDGAVDRAAASALREACPSTFALAVERGWIVSDPHLASWRLGWSPPARPAGAEAGPAARSTIIAIDDGTDGVGDGPAPAPDPFRDRLRELVADIESALAELSRLAEGEGGAR